jgi:glycosyltransferase involved in cell wall biosynthesis
MRIAVLIPCFNEESTIEDVVRGFAATLPDAALYVYDNNSTDQTRWAAERAGALVCDEPRQGKGHVVCRMFADVEADVYVLADGDGTYDPAGAPQMIERMLAEKLDLINGARVAANPQAYPAGHRLGNRVLTGLVAWIFGDRFSDMLSGYKVFSRRFVKSFPALTGGFEIETALTIHALKLRMPTGELPTPYKERPQGSASKLHTFRDGFRILWMILRLVEEERPLQLFGLFSLLFAITSLLLIYPVFVTYLETGLVPRLPTAVLSASLMVLAGLSLVCGLIIDMVTQGRREAKRLRYLALPAPQVPDLPEGDGASTRRAWPLEVPRPEK